MVNKLEWSSLGHFMLCAIRATALYDHKQVPCMIDRFYTPNPAAMWQGVALPLREANFDYYGVHERAISECSRSSQTDLKLV